MTHCFCVLAPAQIELEFERFCRSLAVDYGDGRTPLTVAVGLSNGAVAAASVSRGACPPRRWPMPYRYGADTAQIESLEGEWHEEQACVAASDGLGWPLMASDGL